MKELGTGYQFFFPVLKKEVFQRAWERNVEIFPSLFFMLPGRQVMSKRRCSARGCVDKFMMPEVYVQEETEEFYNFIQMEGKAMGQFPWVHSSCWRAQPSFYPNFLAASPSPFPHWLRYLESTDFRIQTFTTCSLLMGTQPPLCLCSSLASGI